MDPRTERELILTMRVRREHPSLRTSRRAATAGWLAALLAPAAVGAAVALAVAGSEIIGLLVAFVGLAVSVTLSAALATRRAAATVVVKDLVALAERDGRRAAEALLARTSHDTALLRAELQR